MIDQAMLHIKKGDLTYCNKNVLDVCTVNRIINPYFATDNINKILEAGEEYICCDCLKVFGSKVRWKFNINDY